MMRRRLAPVLHRIGLLTPVDEASFAVYCTATAQFIEATKHLADHGSTRVSPNGFETASPWVAIQDRAAKTLHRVGCEFGLTPSSRSRISVEPKDAEDAFDAFVAKRGGGS